MTHVIFRPDDAGHARRQAIEPAVHLVLIAPGEDEDDLHRLVRMARREHAGWEGCLDHLELRAASGAVNRRSVAAWVTSRARPGRYRTVTAAAKAERTAHGWDRCMRVTIHTATKISASASKPHITRLA